MSTPVIYNSVTYNVPAFGDTGYAQGSGNLSSYLIALATGSLNRSGGSFILTNDVNFGSAFGLLANYFTSITTNPATAGRFRLAKTDTIDWRNNANSANLALGINGSDNLTFNGTVVQTGPDNGITALTGDGTATGPGSVPLTLATVNGSVGSFTNANITVNAKGLITAATNGSVSAGVNSIHADSSPDLGGDVQFVSGTNITLSQVGQAITVNATTSVGFQSGDMKAAAYTAVPSGWLLCDGSAVSRTGPNTSLFAAIGTTYGTGDGSTTFNVPNMVNAVPIGAGSTAAMGVTAGANSSAVSITDPGHNHTQNAHHHSGMSGATGTTGFVILSDTGTPNGTTTQTQDIGEFAVSRVASQSVPFVNTGNTTATNNSNTTGITATNSTVQPSLGVTWFIKQ